MAKKKAKGQGASKKAGAKPAGKKPSAKPKASEKQATGDGQAAAREGASEASQPSIDENSAAVVSASKSASRRRVVVVAGSRTPFARAFSELSEHDGIGLGCAAVGGLLERTGLEPKHIDEVVWGSVIFQSGAPNAAREIVLDLNLPRRIPGVTVTRACLSGLQAITHAAAAIERGDYDCAIAGGADSTSSAEVPMPKALVQALAKLSYGGKVTGRKLLKVLREIGSPKNLLPKAPKIAERATGKTMGRHACEMAERNGIAREDQDAFAQRSHALAHAALDAGRFDEEVVPVELAGGRRLERDTLVRSKVDPEKLKSLRPAFRKNGTVTAATSSPLTDGASAVLLMTEEKAKALGLPCDVAITGWTYAALDPFDQLLIGPALAIPKLLDQAEIGLDDVDVFEIHEAFAAQVLSVTQALSSEAFCRDRLGREDAVGEIPEDKLNRHGGSIAIGHPFAATGGRLVTTAANELRKNGAKRAVVSLCAAGAMGGAALLERI